MLIKTIILTALLSMNVFTTGNVEKSLTSENEAIQAQPEGVAHNIVKESFIINEVVNGEYYGSSLNKLNTDKPSVYFTDNELINDESLQVGEKVNVYYLNDSEQEDLFLYVEKAGSNKESKIIKESFVISSSDNEEYKAVNINENEWIKRDKPFLYFNDCSIRGGNSLNDDDTVTAYYLDIGAPEDIFLYVET